MNRFLKKDFRVMLVGLLLLASCQAYSDSEDKTIEMEDLYKDLPFSMPAIERPVFPDYQVNICDFGAKSNGVTLNTEAINNAIKAVHDKGGGKVVIPESLWLTGPIEIYYLFSTGKNRLISQRTILIHSTNLQYHHRILRKS